MNLFKYRFEISPALYRKIDADREEDITSEVGFARRYLNLLVSEIESLLEQKLEEQENPINYDSPNWQLIQADNLAYRRALRKVLKIIGPIPTTGETND